jgi:uncharacterized protein
MNRVEIIVICTYKCNFRCSYCDTIKNDNFAGQEVYDRLANLILRDKNKRFSVKFFGGEPLLFFEYIEKFVNKIGEKKDIKYSLTTNASLLDEEKLIFFNKNKFELAISVDGDFKTFAKNRISSVGLMKKTFNNIIAIKVKYKKNILANMVVSPDAVENFFENFLYLIENDFFKINILAATYVDWTDEELHKLSRELKKIKNFLKENASKNIFIKNKYISNKLFFFNSAVVVDTNGDIFLNNSILLKKFDNLRKDLFLAKIEEVLSFQDIFDKYDNSEIIIKKYERVQKYIEGISRSNTKIDIILNNFVSLI